MYIYMYIYIYMYMHIYTPEFLPGKSYEQRSLVVYSPWGHKEIRHNLATKQKNMYKE